MQTRVKEIFLDFEALSPEEALAWQELLSLAFQVLGLRPSVSHFSGIPQDEGEDFAYIVGSAGFSRKLLLNVPRLWIQPRHGPGRLETFLYFCATQERILSNCKPALPPVSLISSVFRADEYIEGFLENIAALQGYSDFEHWLIRPGSPGSEHERLIRHVREHTGAVYVNLQHDPGLYAVWNFGIQLATGRYLSNANMDDRRAPEQLAYLQSVFEKHPDVAVVSTPLRVSLQKNLTWAASEDCTLLFAKLGEQVYGPKQLFRRVPHGLASRNLPHCMPLWRRSLHAFAGCFDEKRYGPSADWAFWLKAAWQGVRLYIGGPALGLYLRDEESYWRRNPATKEIDARIAEEFCHPSGATEWLGWRAPSLECVAAIGALRNGAVLDGLGRLLLAAVRMVETAGEELGTAGRLIDAVCRRFLGCESGLEWVKRYVFWADQKSIPDFALFNALADLVHSFDPQKLGADAVLVERNLGLACVDWQECYADGRGLALLAMLARRSGKPEGERQLLQRLYSADKVGFWSVVQVAYRFTSPLPALCEAVGAEVGAWMPVKPLDSYRVFFYPAYSNNYQGLLYAPLLAAGGQAIGFRNLRAFMDCKPDGGAGDILHVHWENEIFGNSRLSPDQVADLAGRLLSWLTQQKAAGCNIFWTIHNYLNHECTDHEVEIAFRRALYRLADEVFVHHPLVELLVDWLPDHRKLRLCEHGAYDFAAAFSVTREEARQKLGFPEDAWVVAYVGQVRDYKGLEDVLPVLFEQLTVQPKMQLLIAGQLKSPKVRDWLVSHPHQRLTVLDTFLNDEELICSMRAADVGLLAYKSILTSGNLFHWLSCGRSVIAPAIGTIPAYVVSGWNGWLYNDTDDLRRWLAVAGQLPLEETKRLELNALETACQLKWRVWGT